MNAFASSYATSIQGLEAQAERLRVTSENIANADTPGYHRKMISFGDAIDGATPGTRENRVTLDDRPPERIHDPSHPLADETGHYEGSNVDLILEVADAREAQRSYEANLKVFDQTRQMSSALLELLKR